MAWTLRGAHLLLQTRTKVLNQRTGECLAELVSAIPPCGKSGLTPDLVLHSLLVNTLANRTLLKGYRNRFQITGDSPQSPPRIQ